MVLLSKTPRQMLAQNAGREVDRFAMKLVRLRSDPFAFLRGTNPLFLESLPRRHALFNAPRVLLCGDLHLEIFGAAMRLGQLAAQRSLQAWRRYARDYDAGALRGRKG